MNIETKLQHKIKNVFEQSGIQMDAATISIESTKTPLHGDYSCNIAMKMAGVMKKKPHDIAELIIRDIDMAGIEKIEIAGPGFINFFMSKDEIKDVIAKVVDLDSKYGQKEKNNSKINVEFVSANPTGDLHLGHARVAAVGDCIARLYEKCGYAVTREFYVNDAGNQINNLAKSLMARYQHLCGNLDYKMPEDGYYAQDIYDIAKIFYSEYKEQYKDVTDKNLEFIKQYGIRKELDKIKKDLDLFKVTFDKYTFESEIRENEHVEHVLKEKFSKFSYISEGATFLKTSDFLDDKDRPVVKSDGSFTYLMPDIAYHLRKLSFNYDLLIDVLGADHHGYINRMKSALMMQGYKEDILEAEFVQVVRLIKDSKEVKMSKRTGTGVSLRELCSECGVDAVRYFFISRSQDSHLDFDLNLATEKSSANPVYYAQYAHARLSKLFETASDIEIDLKGVYLNELHEMNLLKCIIEYPKVIEIACNRRSPHLITTYIQKLAGCIHAFYTECRVINRDDIKVTSSRLGLAKASQITLKNALNLIGVDAPNRM